MPSTANSKKPSEKAMVLPTNRPYPAPFDLTGDVTKCSFAKDEVTDCNPKYFRPPEIPCPVCGKTFRREYNMNRHKESKHRFASSEEETKYSIPEVRRTNDSTKDSGQEMHVFSDDQLPQPESISCKSNNLQIQTQGGNCQPPSQDDNTSPEFMVKRENSEDGLGYLHRLSSSEPGQSHATPEELDRRDSPQITESDESFSTTESYIDNRKRQVIEGIIFAVMQWLPLELDAWRKNAGGNSTSASRISEALPSSHLRTGSSVPTNRGNKKRKAADVDDHGTEDEDESGNNEGPRSSNILTQAQGNPKYACPYFKYNPAKYKDWRTCPGPGWNDVHRVKEHLYRRHRQPQYRCARCWQPFTDEQGLTDHQRAHEPCPLREMEYVEGFDAAQERSLKSRKRAGQTLSEAEKWRRVFKILFPHVLDDDIPSPFYDYNQMSQQDACRHLESGSLAQCEQYMLREVPQRLRQALGRELDRDLTIVEDNLRRRAGDCVRTLIGEVFQELRQIGRLGSPAPRLEANNDISAPAEGPQLLMSELPSGEGANPYFEGQGEAWPINFDLDFFAPSSILEELQFPFNNGGLIEDLLGPGDDGAGEATKQSDSGYVSNSPG